MANLFAQPYISPPDYDTVEFSSKKEILLVQKSAIDEFERCQQGSAMARQEIPPQQVDSGGMRMMNNALWIPERAVELQLRLYVEAHCRSAGHRAYEATLGGIKEHVAWTTMAKDVKVFVQNCLHCVATIPADKVQRPLGMQLHATKPNEILHFDFLYIGLSRDGKYQHLLLLKDDLSGYLWLVPCRTADAMDIGQRQPLQERSGTTSTEGTQGQASFHYGKLSVVERHYRVRMQASHTCFSCSAIRAEDVRSRVARSG
jgi:Integrase zinc binding domain